MATHTAITNALRIAASKTDTNPTDAEKKNDTYAKGNLRIHGLDVAIESPKGSERSGKDNGGKRWSVTMPAHYGEIRNTEGKDGDPLDVYIGPAHGSEKVFVVDQVNAENGKFDEHKAMLSYPSKSAALSDYEKAFSDGKAKDRIGAVTELSIVAFRDWVMSGDTKKPLGRIGSGAGDMGKTADIKAKTLAMARKYAHGGAVRGFADGGVPDWRSDMDAPLPEGAYDIRSGEVVAPRRPAILREAPTGSMPTATDRFLDYGALPAKAATSVAMQPVTAGIAVNDAIQDPSLPNVGNAAFQSAMAFFQPAKALKALGLSYGATAAKDAGLMPFGTAHAEPDGPLSPDQMKRMVALQKKQERGSLSRAEREEQNNLMGIQRDYAAAAARAKFEAQARRDAMDAELSTKRGTLDAEAQAAKKADELAEYNRSVKGAERARDTELARNRRFSDTETGRLWDKTGGFAPAMIAAGLGGLSRAASGGGSNLKNYGMPIAEGAIAGGLASNIPLAYNAFFTEPDNPERRAYEAYARELPPGHPRKGEFADYAKSLDKKNPIREVASEELYDPVKALERIGFGALEGIGGGLAGSAAVRLPGRAVDAMAGLPGRALSGWHEGMEKASRASVGASKEGAKALKADQSLQDARRSVGATRGNDALVDQAQDVARRRLSDQTGGPGQPEAAGRPRPQRSVEDQTSSSGTPTVKITKNNSTPSGERQANGDKSKKKSLTKSELLEVERLLRDKTAGRLSGGGVYEAPTVIYKTPRKHGGKVSGWYTRAENGRFRGGAVIGKSATDMGLETARKYAAGGSVLVGPVVGSTGGREDALPVSVPNGSFVIPADVVSSLGSGNTMAGMERLKGQFGEAPRRASGGAVPIQISDGEFVLSPEQVAKVGGGDMDRGHAILDKLILKLRDEHIRTLKSLPGPAKGAE